MSNGEPAIDDTALDSVAAAMVAVRRLQSRRALARSAGASAAETAAQEVLDAVDAADRVPDRPIGVTGVAAALGVDQPRASKLVTAAVTAGLLRREPVQGDGRRTRLVLTPAGRARLDAVHAFRRERFGAAMAGWERAEQATFAALLDRFVAALESQKA